MGLFDRFRSRSTPEPDGRDTSLVGFAGEVDVLIRGGFRTPEQLIEAVRELAAAHDPPVKPVVAHSLLTSRIASWRKEQASWPAVTDPDRVAAAFAELEASGILARMDFEDCSNCAADALRLEIEDGTSARGYVYFHQQVTDDLAAGGLGALQFGQLGQVADQDELEERTVAIGREVVAALERHAVPVGWNGMAGRRIALGPLDWKRRPTPQPS